jgi:RNA polymerase sigma factor (sigma-70 family)
MSETVLLSQFSPAEEQALFVAARAGRQARAELGLCRLDAERGALLEQQMEAGEAAHSVIFQGMQRLAESLARATARRFACSEVDLTQQALIKLNQLIESFDEMRGVRFSTYAYRSLQRDLVTAARSGKMVTTIPHWGWLASEVQVRESQGAVDERALAFELGVTPADIREVQKQRQYRAVSLEEGEQELAVLPPDDEDMDLHRALQRLPATAQLIIKMRFGFPPYHESHKLGEIAEATGCSTTTVKRILGQATTLLRQNLVVT